MKLSILWVLLQACGATHAPTTTLSIAGHTLEVEIADDDAERSKGLMHRDTMPDARGMLFVYEDDKPRRFWMKDTRLPLSIAFLDHKGKIVRLADMQPFTTEGTSSLYPARFALEVNQGWFAKHQITVGTVVEGLDDVRKASTEAP